MPICTSSPCVYTEGVHVGWRALEDVPVAFPFGHGLSYSSFDWKYALPPVVIRGDPADEGSGLLQEVPPLGPYQDPCPPNLATRLGARRSIIASPSQIAVSGVTRRGMHDDAQKGNHNMI